MDSDEKRPLVSAAEQSAGEVEDEDIEINLGGFLLNFVRKWYIWMGALILGALAALAVTSSPLVKPTFTATAKLYMVSTENTSALDMSSVLTATSSLAADYAQLITVNDILDSVITENNLPYTATELLDMISIRAISNTRLLRISVQSTDSGEAAAIANSLAQKAADQIPVMMDLNNTKPEIVERAKAPQKPTSPNVQKKTMEGALAGLAIGLMIVAVLFLTDDTMKTADDMKRKLGTIPLAVIPESEIPGQNDESGSGRQAERRIRKRRAERL